jgi:hypothetical protein
MARDLTESRLETLTTKSQNLIFGDFLAEMASAM